MDCICHLFVNVDFVNINSLKQACYDFVSKKRQWRAIYPGALQPPYLFMFEQQNHCPIEVFLCWFSTLLSFVDFVFMFFKTKRKVLHCVLFRIVICVRYTVPGNQSKKQKMTSTFSVPKEGPMLPKYFQFHNNQNHQIYYIHL